MFTVLIEKQNVIWQRLLDCYFPNGANILDFTTGTGTLHKCLDLQKYRLTLCDKHPGHIVKDLMLDDYDDLGLHDCAFFDPPCLIERVCFDYPTQSKGTSPTQWISRRLEHHVSNQSLEEFNARIVALNIKAPTVLKQGGLLFCKVMDTRHNGTFIPHHFNIWKTLTHFTLIDHAIYVRQGATTWESRHHLQNLHGHWMVFRLNPDQP
jgi:hypothetical protein